MPKQTSSKDSSIVNLFNALKKRVSESNEVLGDEASLLDISLSAAKEFFERQAAGGLSLLRANLAVDDFIGIKNEPVELTFDVDIAQALASIRVQFFVDGTSIGLSTIGSEHKARIKFLQNQSCCYPITYKIFSKTGLDISDRRAEKGVILHVLDKAPIVCIDASLIKPKKAKLDEQLTKMSEQGFDIVYIDFGDKDRVDEIRKIRHERSLPIGAIIPLTARIRQYESFDVDFKQSFFSLAINRLTAK